ncbi:MAG: hypothetical protein J5586_03275 [Clostridia bacterium]|nr:hypothetical protein [Clostridia bacterium]
MKHAVRTLLLIALIAALASTACIDTGPREIRPGQNGKCSDELRAAMEKCYGLYIPECADFVGGRVYWATREPSVYVAFDIKLSEWEGWREGMDKYDLFLLLSHGAELFSDCNYDNYDVQRRGEDFGRDYGDGRGYTGYGSRGFSYIVCSDPEKDTVSFLFHGDSSTSEFR